MTDGMMDAWRRAQADLAIEVVAPFELSDEERAVSAHCVAWIATFGSAAGTVVTARHDDDAATAGAIAKSKRIFFSILDERSYGEYDRQLFIDTLNDWGWYGPEVDAPVWYTGQPWTD